MARRILFLACAVAVAAGAPAAHADTSAVEQAGISVAFSLADGPGLAGRAATAQVLVSDAHTGQPILSAHPLAWLLAWPQPRPPTPEECRDRIRTLLDSKLGWRADAEMNGHRLLVLQDDASLAVLNPLASLGGSRVERLIRLPAAGAAMQVSAEGRVVVTLPAHDAVAILDSDGRGPPAIVSTGPGSRPGALAAAGDGTLWAALDGVGAVARLDVAGRTVGSQVPVGAGRQTVIAAGRSHVAAFASDASSIVLLDADPARLPVTVPLPARPVAAEYGAAGQEVVVLLEDGGLLGLAPDQARPARPLARHPDGRFALLLEGEAGRIAVLDTADGTVAGFAAVPGHPDQAAFTTRFAYVRGAGSDQVAVIALDGLRQGRPEPVLVPVGAGPAQAAGPSLPVLVPAPDGTSAYIADAVGRGTAYYTEGMMAPAGVIAGTGAAPMGLVVQDRSLREASPGRYEAPLLPRRAGQFIVPVLLDQPRFAHCFMLSIAEDPDSPRGGTIDARALFGEAPLRAGSPARLAYAVREADGSPARGLHDVRLVATDDAGQWQLRRVLQGGEDGTYSAELRFPRPGSYAVSLSLGSRGLGFGAMPATRVTVLPESAP